jgi:hypothetical protein
MVMVHVSKDMVKFHLHITYILLDVVNVPCIRKVSLLRGSKHMINVHLYVVSISGDMANAHMKRINVYLDTANASQDIVKVSLDMVR